MLNFDNPIRQKVFNGLGWEQIVEKLKPAGRIIEKPFVTLPDGQFQPIYAPAAMKFVEQPSTDFLGVSLDGYTDYQRKGGKRVFVWEKAPGVQDQVNLGAEANGVVKDATGEEGPVGGINLNPELLKMLIETDASTGKIKPIAPERLKNLKFDGFRPVILRIEPIKNIPLLLGINEGQLPQRQADKNPAQKIPNDLSYALPGKWYGEN